MQDVAGRRRIGDLRRYTEKLERLCHLTADVARLGNERSTLKKIVDTAADLIGVQGAHIALVDKDEQQLYGVISSGRHPQDAPRLKIQLSQSAAAQQALKTCKPVAIVYLCDVDPPFRTRYISPQVKSMLGYPPQEWVSDPYGFCLKIVHPEDVGALIDLTAEAARTSGFVTAEYRLLDRRGEVRWFRDECALVRDPSGTPIAWHGVLVEITGMKKMQH